LAAGVTFGSLLLSSGYMIAKTDNIYEGHLLGTGSSGVLAVAMTHRYLKTGKFMPAGLVAILGAAVCAYNFNKSAEWAPSKAGRCFRNDWKS